MRKIVKTLIFLTLTVAFASCKQEPVPPYQYATDLSFNLAKVNYYGEYYPGNENHVLSLELFSKDLIEVKKDSIIGIGQKLYFEDVFIPNPENTLVPGKYSVSSEGEMFTFLPGENLKIDYFTELVGARINYYEKDKGKSTVKRIIEGSFTVGEDMQISFELKTSDKLELKGTFKGEIEYKNMTPQP